MIKHIALADRAPSTIQAIATLRQDTKADKNTRPSRFAYLTFNLNSVSALAAWRVLAVAMCASAVVSCVYSRAKAIDGDELPRRGTSGKRGYNTGIFRTTQHTHTPPSPTRAHKPLGISVERVYATE